MIWASAPHRLLLPASSGAGSSASEDGRAVALDS